MTLEGQFQIYTGDGKGKTTAALGLAVRAAGAGMRVYIGQFIKDEEYHEVPLLRRLGVVVELYGARQGMSDWKASGTGGFGCSGRRTEKGAGCPAKRAV